jgi:hypothetical protein
MSLWLAISLYSLVSSAKLYTSDSTFSGKSMDLFSKWHNVTSGIPQGSVLGSVLFVLFIDDLPLNVESDVYNFADDTKLYREIANQSDIEIVQNDINNLFKWSF